MLGDDRIGIGAGPESVLMHDLYPFHIHSDRWSWIDVSKLCKWLINTI